MKGRVWNLESPLKEKRMMIKTLITDDEKLIRAGLKKILTEAFPEDLEIFEAKNGKEALDFVLNNQIQILITDIRMPILDGVELMRSIRAMEDPPDIIVLSGFDDFSYAKEAIVSGAVSYLLKPVDKEELKQTVSQAIKKIHQRSKSEVHTMLQKVMLNGVIENNLPLQREFSASGFYCIAVHSQFFNPLMREINSSDYYVLEQKRYITLALVSFFDGRKIKDDHNIDSRYKVSFSSLCTNLSSLRLIRDQALCAFMEFYISDKSGCAVYSEEHMVFDFSHTDALFEKFVRTIHNGRIEDICAAVSELCSCFDIDEKKKGTVLYYVYNLVSQNLPKRFSGYSENDSYLAMKNVMIEQLWNCPSIKIWINYVIDYAVYISVIIKKNAVEFPFIYEALDYITKHYSENINMTMVANAVSVNYTYFSEKFKEHTGKNFNEYMKILRVQKAKELLEKGCYKVYEVSQKTGFSDVKYFMKIFKEVTGTSPGKYHLGEMQPATVIENMYNQDAE
jgi:two-component system response regulator YesN